MNRMIPPGGLPVEKGLFAGNWYDWKLDRNVGNVEITQSLQDSTMPNNSRSAEIVSWVYRG